MSKKRIIAISRTYGSGGHEIGELLAKSLGISFYDRNLLQLMAEKTGISEQGLQNADEKLLSSVLNPYFMGNGIDYNNNIYLYRMQSRLISSLAEKESCVIIGRMADTILKDRDDVLKVFIDAPTSYRTARIMEKKDVTEEQALHLMKQVDKLRDSYYSFFSDRRWERTKGRDLIINSALLGTEGSAGLLKYAVEHS